MLKISWLATFLPNIELMSYSNRITCQYGMCQVHYAIFKIFKYLDPNESFVSIPFEWRHLCNSDHSQTPYNNGKAQARLEVWQAKFEAEY